MEHSEKDLTFVNLVSQDGKKERMGQNNIWKDSVREFFQPDTFVKRYEDINSRNSTNLK